MARPEHQLPIAPRPVLLCASLTPRHARRRVTPRVSRSLSLQLEGQSSDDRALALRLREQADKATAALEEATRKAEDYRLQLAASAQAAQRVKEKEASLAQQQAREGAAAVPYDLPLPP